MDGGELQRALPCLLGLALPLVATGAALGLLAPAPAQGAAEAHRARAHVRLRVLPGDVRVLPGDVRLRALLPLAHVAAVAEREAAAAGGRGFGGEGRGRGGGRAARGRRRALRGLVAVLASRGSVALPGAEGGGLLEEVRLA